jgi:hypothetical protein
MGRDRRKSCRREREIGMCKRTEIGSFYFAFVDSLGSKYIDKSEMLVSLPKYPTGQSIL